MGRWGDGERGRWGEGEMKNRVQQFSTCCFFTYLFLLPSPFFLLFTLSEAEGPSSFFRLPSD